MNVVGGNVREAVYVAVATAAELPVDEISADARLLDLGLDSFSFAGILIDMEDDLGAEVPIQLLDELVEPGRDYTVREFVDLFELLVSRASATREGRG